MTNKGGRSGEVEAPDGSLSLKIAPPGAGDATNPEQLFAAGYSSCFNSALELVISGKKSKRQALLPRWFRCMKRKPLTM